jgi:hypothetical protein
VVCDRFRIAYNETRSIFDDLAMYAGQGQNAAFYALRPGLSVVAHLFFFLPVWSAVSLAIAVMAAIAAGSMYFIGRRNDLPPFLCAILGLSTYLLGSVSFHLADYSSHIAGPATWTFASLVVLVLRPWEAGASWRTFALAHLTFWVIVPFYWSNIVLYCALVLMFVAQPRRLAISVALLIGCYFWRDVWSYTMNAAYGGSVDYGLTETIYLKNATSVWLEIFRTGDALHIAVPDGFASTLEKNSIDRVELMGGY